MENPIGKFSVIPRVGVALSNWSNNSIYVSVALGDEIKSKNQAGFMAGADVEYRATEYVGVSLGAYYARLGYRFADYETVESADKKQYWGIKNHHADIDYIQLPLMLKCYVTRQLGQWWAYRLVSAAEMPNSLMRRLLWRRTRMVLPIIRIRRR